MRYVALSTGWIAGRPVAKGETVWLSAEQAKYEPVAPAPVGGKVKRRKTEEVKP